MDDVPALEAERELHITCFSNVAFVTGISRHVATDQTAGP